MIIVIYLCVINLTGARTIFDTSDTFYVVRQKTGPTFTIVHFPSNHICVLDIFTQSHPTENNNNNNNENRKWGDIHSINKPEMAQTRSRINANGMKLHICLCLSICLLSDLVRDTFSETVRWAINQRDANACANVLGPGVNLCDDHSHRNGVSNIVFSFYDSDKNETSGEKKNIFFGQFWNAEGVLRYCYCGETIA